MRVRSGSMEAAGSDERTDLDTFMDCVCVCVCVDINVDDDEDDVD